MSKTVHLIFVFLTAWFLHLKTGAQVPNGDFEAWQTMINQNIQNWMQSGKVSAISASQQGPYAVKLEHDSLDHSTALLLHGGYVNGVGFTGGFPYSQRPDTIRGYFKCYSPNPTDLALMHVITKKNGIQLSADYFFINVNSDTSQFQMKKFKINYNSTTEIPDSIIIVLTNPNPFQDSLYTGYLIADNLSFNTSEPIPNGNFDNWNITQVDNPFDWASFNIFGIISGNYPVHKVSDCVSGSFAAKSQNILTPSDTIPGVIVSSVGGNWPAKAFPVNQRHTSLKGSYKFFPENNDTLTLILLLYKSDTVVGVASFKTADSADTYKTFDIPVVYWEFFFGIPDSALLYAGPYNFDGGSPRGNSVMYIDNLHFIQNNQIVINEVVSSNTSSLYDAEGNAEDWIELYNGGGSPVVINNYFLSDDTAQAQKWRLPMYLLPPDSFLVVFASGRDTYYPDLHTNFQIKTEGEPVLLTSPTGQIINAFPPRELAADISWGRFPDASNSLYLFAEPTPRKPNNTAFFQGFTEAIPAFSLPPGFYTDSIYLGISSTHPGAQIRYTLDGSEPTVNSTAYTSPILLKSRAGQPNTYSMIEETTPWWGWSYPQGEVFKTNIVRAKIFINDSISLRTATGTYYVDDSIFSRYTLPVLSLVTDSMNLFGYEKGIYIRGKIYDDYVAQHPNDTNLFTPANYFMRGDAWERPVHIEYFSHDGQLLLAQDAGLRAHGGASRMFRQKALKLYSRDKYGNDYFDYPVFPGHKAKVSQDDILHYKNLLLRTSGNDNDQTFFRDALVHTLVSHTSIDVMALQPASVFLNGEYWGIHNFREREDKYYMEQHYGVDPDSVAILEGPANVSEGNDSDRMQYLSMISYIDSHNMAIQSDFDFISTQMDIDNFLDYQSIEIYIRNTDWPGNNIRYWRKRLPQNMPAAATGNDGRWRWLLFDTDFSFGQHDGMDAPVHNTLEFATDSDNISWPNPE